MRRISRVCHALLLALLLRGQGSPARAAPDDDAAILAALFPSGIPALPYTLYPYHGPIDHSARILARSSDGAGELIGVAVVSAPRASGYDAQGRVGLALLARKSAGWRVLASSGFPAQAGFAGSVGDAQVLRDYPAAGDRGLRYTYTLSGSGAARTTYLRVYHRTGPTLWEALAVQLEQRIAAGACCAVGETAAVRAVPMAGGPPAYAVRLAGYARHGSTTDSYESPGTIIYTAHDRVYLPERLQLPNTSLALARLPVLASLPGAGQVAWPDDAAHAHLPGALAALHAGSGVVVGAQVAAEWDASGLRLLVRDGPGWPSGTLPARLDLYLQPYGARAPTHLSFSTRAARCTATVSFSGSGFTCMVLVPGLQAAGAALPALPGPDHRTGVIHRYRVVAATRLGLALTAPGSAQQRYSLDPDTSARRTGRLSTLLLLAPA